ncbi:MAG: 4-alpha-glucanotransferase [Porphyromonas sp.]|nr:4-alpha-glucanotransferase [Porphyromonas sp.]
MYPNHIRFELSKIVADGEDVRLRIIELEGGVVENLSSPSPMFILSPLDHDRWAVNLKIKADKSATEIVLKYSYGIYRNDLLTDSETSGVHELRLSCESCVRVLTVKDDWRYSVSLGLLDNQLFDVILRSDETSSPFKVENNKIYFFLPSFFNPLNDSLYISGSIEELGSWNPEEALPFRRLGNRLIAEIENAEKQSFEYKLIVKTLSGAVEWEVLEGNRVLRMDGEEGIVVNLSLPIFNSISLPRISGTVVPLFSLRTNDSFGIGEFADLKMVVDWVKQTNQQVIQLLPIYDTNFSASDERNYPYNSISTFALNPVYLSLKSIASKDILQKLKRLDRKDKVAYSSVLTLKMEAYRLYFEQLISSKEWMTKDYIFFYETHSSDLIEYALFKLYSSEHPDRPVSEWMPYETYLKEKIGKKRKCSSLPLELHYYIYLQYLLYSQLLDAKAYAREKKVALKGDLPIGIAPNSVDSWVRPHLLNMNLKAGAPPDFFATEGQCWGFPTYNWKAIATEGYKWWTNRMKVMALIYDAIRIDHILGFFRIWSVPEYTDNACCGYFDPSIPLDGQTISQYVPNIDIDTLTLPLVTEEYTLSIASQKEVDELLDAGVLIRENNTLVMPEPKCRLLSLSLTEKAVILAEKIRGECLFIKDANGGLQPRVLPESTVRYSLFSQDEKMTISALHHHYFHERNDALWYKTAMERLDRLSKSTRMLLCGEDLGFMTNAVPHILKKYNILSLNLPRISRKPEELFMTVSDVDYRCVLSTGTHDMPSLRVWWGSLTPQEQTRVFLSMVPPQGLNYLFQEPMEMGGLVNTLVKMPALAVILPIQDWWALTGKYDHISPEQEQINRPDDPVHVWNYRIPETVENLLADRELKRKISKTIASRSRNL